MILMNSNKGVRMELLYILMGVYDIKWHFKNKRANELQSKNLNF